MFKSIRLRNFKSYRDSGHIPLAPLTIIIGKNNVGKSTILHALFALAQTSDITLTNTKALVTRGPMADLNGFFDVLHGQGSMGKTFSIALTLSEK
jgi:AAA15 family ATPase/GTPase